MNLKSSSIPERSALLLALVLLLVLGCKTVPPKIDVAIYAGDSANDQVARNATDRISAREPRFDTGAWLSYVDLKKFMDALLQCKQWPESLAPMTDSEAAAALNTYLDISKKAKDGPQASSVPKE